MRWEVESAPYFAKQQFFEPARQKRVKLRHGSKSAPLPLFPLKAEMR
jgi:hypothetical protein